MRFATLCSGIGSPEVAFYELGWNSQFCAEINEFSSAVLSFRFPSIQNLGDVSKIDGGKYYGTIDLIAAGTPCTGFSVAGKRKGLDDSRSRLALSFVEVLIQIRPKWFVWENTPGIINRTGSPDFATFLGLLTGQNISPPTRFSNTGIIRGIKSAYSVAWRILDAQYFGVPQCRRRIFVVGYLGDDWRPPASVLIEQEILPRAIKKSQSQKKGLTARSKSRARNSTGQHAVAYCFTPNDHGQDARINQSPTLRAGNWGASGMNGFVAPAIAYRDRVHDWCVRRLTPKECERLQGFPDGWTDIPFHSKTKRWRYWTLGNSIAVPVMRWLGDRIQRTEELI